MRDTTDYKQLAFKLQDDIKTLNWERAQKDIPFLKEIKDRIEKYQQCKDVTQFEMAITMIDDWICELEKN